MMKAPKNPSTQPRLFQVIDMEELVPPHHILRQINEAVDFSVIHDWVAPLYTEKTWRTVPGTVRLFTSLFPTAESHRTLVEMAQGCGHCQCVSQRSNGY